MHNQQTSKQEDIRRAVTSLNQEIMDAEEHKLILEQFIIKAKALNKKAEKLLK